MKYKPLFQFFFLLMLAMSALRIAFILQNASFFSQIDPSLYFVGAYFDASTIALLALPLFVLLNPLTDKLNLRVKTLSNVLVKVIWPP